MPLVNHTELWTSARRGQPRKRFCNGGPPRLQLTLWGDFRIADVETGEAYHLRGRKAQGLLAYLATHPGKAFSRERLGSLLWGDRADTRREPACVKP